MKTFVFLIFCVFSSVSFADNLVLAAHSMCLQKSGEFRLQPVQIYNAEDEDLVQLVSLNPGENHINCKAGSLVVDTIIHYEDSSDFSRHTGNSCSSSINARVDVTVNDDVVVRDLPFSNNCKWGHMHSLIVGNGLVSVCYQGKGGDLAQLASVNGSVIDLFCKKVWLSDMQEPLVHKDFEASVAP